MIMNHMEWVYTKKIHHKHNHITHLIKNWWQGLSCTENKIFNLQIETNWKYSKFKLRIKKLKIIIKKNKIEILQSRD